MKHILIYIFILAAMLMSCGKKTEETKPIRKDVTETVFASGVLEANNTYNLVAQNDGYLITINFNEGDIISKGRTLAVIDNKENNINTQGSNELLTIAQNNTQSNAPLLMQAKNNVEIAKRKMEQDAVQEQRYKKLWDENSISKIDYENIQLAYKTSKGNYDIAVENLKKLQNDANQQLVNTKISNKINRIIANKNNIIAVTNGKVYQKLKQQGDFVKKGDVIAVIGDPNFIYAKINVDEGNIGKIKINQDVTVQLNTNNSKTYKAVVYEIAPSFDAVTQSFICKLRFTEPLDFSIVKTQLQANIILGEQKNALLIPRNYIDYGGFVQEKGKKEKTKIETRFISNQWVQVLSGIDDKAVLVTENLSKQTK